LELRGSPEPPIPVRVAKAPTPVGQAAMTEATMLPWLPEPFRTESQSSPEPPGPTTLLMMEWILRVLGPKFS